MYLHFSALFLMLCGWIVLCAEQCSPGARWKSLRNVSFITRARARHTAYGTRCKRSLHVVSPLSLACSLVLHEEEPAPSQTLALSHQHKFAQVVLHARLNTNGTGSMTPNTRVL